MFALSYNEAITNVLWWVNAIWSHP